MKTNLQVSKPSQRMGNFTKIRNGLKDHIEAAQFTPVDLGVYLFLHLYAQWDSCICWTSAAGIASTFDHDKIKVAVRQVQDSLHRLRSRGYIDYPKGNGHRGGYPVLL